MALVSGDRLGPYTVERLLGAGGMGEVYQGVDTRLGRAVALKVISQPLVGDDSRRRFETEARAASALNHPVIVTIYDVGETGGRSWIAMELVEGRSLRDAIAQGPLPVRQAWSIARQLAEGLAVAHAKGVVHRDLKPENVMLTNQGGVKILDFGLARQVVAPTIDGTSAAPTVTDAGTVAGAILGTVGYMAPEQATGQSADFRSDHFSLGAVVYEMLAGQRAFHRRSTVETLSAILRDEPPPIGTVRGDVSGAFQRVIGRCLEKEPAHRFESTRELATALEALTPESTTAEAPSHTSPAFKGQPWSRRAGVVAAVMVAVIAAVASGGLLLLRNRESGAALPAITSVAVLPFDNTARDPDIDYISDGLTDGLIDHLSRAESLTVMARATVMRFKGQQNPQEAARALKVGAVVTGALSRRGSQVVISAELIGATGERLWGQTFDRPMTELMRVQDSIVSSIADGLRLRLTGEEKARLAGFGTDNPESYELLLKGRQLMQQETEEADLEARKLFQQATERDPGFLDAYVALSSTYAREAGSGYGSPREAAAHADAALEKAAAIDPNNVSVRVARAHGRFTATHDWAAAEREYRALMHEPALLRTALYHPISLFFVAIGKPDEAVALVERALVVDPGNLESRAMLGNFLFQAGRLDEALKVYDAFAAEQPEDDRPLFGVADVYARRGDFKRAAEARRKAHGLEGDEDAARAFVRVTTEDEYARAELTVARARLRMLEELVKGRYVDPLDIARAHARVGNREQALTGLERAAKESSYVGGYVGLVLLKVDRAWDSVRADPRFAAVVRRVGIP